ncbi:hypothetical protein T265_01916 [Opisthorchis viverrini]|uniref:Uncharacterized protein n=1 Tax=Opisthorchis viverrini TaxID=6198 RepID=A0A075AIP4_OPIVI|nr:hypothetical protein T265_01916 [Opisthorchis viverrini]KER31989.1 hypothetical protein T265_01916 [Opisthorchis viverrini]
MLPEVSMRAGILPGCPSLERGSREAEVGFEPRTFRSCLGTMLPEGSTRVGILPGCPSLGRGSREAEIGFEPQGPPRELADRKVRGSNPTLAIRLLLPRLRQPDIMEKNKVALWVKKDKDKAFSCSTLPVPSCHATRRKYDGWDTARLPKPRQGKSSGGGRIRTADLQVSNPRSNHFGHLAIWVMKQTLWNYRPSMSTGNEIDFLGDVLSCHATRRKQEGGDTSGLPEPGSRSRNATVWFQPRTFSSVNLYIIHWVTTRFIFPWTCEHALELSPSSEVGCSVQLKACSAARYRSTITPFRCLAAMPPGGSTRAGTLLDCPSLDRGSRVAEVGFGTFRTPALGVKCTEKRLSIINRIRKQISTVVGHLWSYDPNFSHNVTIFCRPYLESCVEAHRTADGRPVVRVVLQVIAFIVLTGVPARTSSKRMCQSFRYNVLMLTTLRRVSVQRCEPDRVHGREILGDMIRRENFIRSDTKKITKRLRIEQRSIVL